MRHLFAILRGRFGQFKVSGIIARFEADIARIDQAAEHMVAEVESTGRREVELFNRRLHLRDELARANKVRAKLSEIIS